MQVFVAFNISHQALVRARILKSYDGNYFDAGNGSFFISTDGETTRQVATKIGLGDDADVTSGIVISVTTYWGRYNKDLWEWISVKMNANGK